MLTNNQYISLLSLHGATLFKGELHPTKIEHVLLAQYPQIINTFLKNNIP